MLEPIVYFSFHAAHKDAIFLHSFLRLYMIRLRISQFKWLLKFNTRLNFHSFSVSESIICYISSIETECAFSPSYVIFFIFIVYHTRRYVAHCKTWDCNKNMEGCFRVTSNHSFKHFRLRTNIIFHCVEFPHIRASHEQCRHWHACRPYLHDDGVINKSAQVRAPAFDPLLSLYDIAMQCRQRVLSSTSWL